MKNQIEKKLGRSIEDYIELENEIHTQYDGMESDWNDPFYNLTDEEIDFFEEYVKNLDAA